MHSNADTTTTEKRNINCCQKRTHAPGRSQSKGEARKRNQRLGEEENCDIDVHTKEERCPWLLNVSMRTRMGGGEFGS
jgi:hypothetical protein